MYNTRGIDWEPRNREKNGRSNGVPYMDARDVNDDATNTTSSVGWRRGSRPSDRRRRRGKGDSLSNADGASGFSLGYKDPAQEGMAQTGGHSQGQRAEEEFSVDDIISLSKPASNGNQNGRWKIDEHIEDKGYKSSRAKAEPYRPRNGLHGARYDPSDYSSAPVHIPTIFLSRGSSKAGRAGGSLSHRRRAAARRTEAGVLLLLLVAGISFVLSMCRFISGSLSLPSTNSLSDAMSSMSIFGGGGPEQQLERSTIALLRHTKSQYQGWPLSVRNEETKFELLRHPGEAEDVGGRTVELAVPKFYVLNSLRSAFFDGKLLTRKVADFIGTFTSEKARKAGDTTQRTIFVSIISYRNARCRDTVDNIFARAAHPERIRVGVVDQIDSSDISCDVPAETCERNPNQALCRYRNQIDVYEIESNLAVGPIFARHISQRLYRGEWYYLQIDADVTFVKRWDVDIVDQFERAGNDMAVITTYLLDVTDTHYNAETGLAAHQSRYLVCDAGFTGIGQQRRLRHEKTDQPERNSHIGDSPQLQPFWAAEFSFSRGHFVLTTPYDAHLAMIEREDEEISMAIRGFSNGYDYYAPMHNVCFNGQASAAADALTQQSQGEHGEENVFAAKQEVHSFKEHADKYKGKYAASIMRLLALVDMGADGEEWDRTEEEKYGTGRVRLTSKMFTCFGIHVESKITERKLCDFVSSGMMHSTFLDHLRIDGMGIDYGDFYFHYHELLRVHEGW
jgi:[Skp1-protein]-hydroxyproline N-acetylglucosaminyltransferase